MTREIRGDRERVAFAERKVRATDRLRELGVAGPLEYAFDIPEEKDAQGDVIPAEIFWVRFPSPADDPDIPSVEGKIYVPRGANLRDEVVLFVPGFPGGKAGRFERNYAKSIVDRGSTFVTLRHNATGIETQPAEVDVFNCAERLADGRREGQEHLGPPIKGGYTMKEIVREPVAALRAIAPMASKIKLAGNSAGVTSLFWSVDRLRRTHPEITDKITHLVSLAGYIGEDREDAQGLVHGFKMKMDDLARLEIAAAKEDGVALTEDPARFAQSLRELARELGQVQIPEHITQVMVISPEDPIIASPVIKVSKQVEGGRTIEVVERYDYPGHTARTLVVEDHTQDKKHHTLPGLLPKTFERLLDLKHPGRIPHFVAVKEKQPKSK